MCECTDMSMDLATPRNAYLSAFYKRSFAYHTVKNRMPVIVTQIIDNLSRNKEVIIKEFGEKASEDLKTVIGELSMFKYEVQTNKPLTKLTTKDPDIRIFNEYIDKQAAEEGETTHFNTIWLLTECYMYRRIKEIFALTDSLATFDYFRFSKEEQFEKSKDLIVSLSKYVAETVDNLNKCDRKKEVLKMLKINLWGNKCDLSISLGKVEGPGKLLDPNDLEPFVLADDTERIYQILTTTTMTNDEIIDIVLDNSGYEVFTDLCLMDFLTAFSMAKKVRFHVKAIPWFISDVTEPDFHWTIEQLCTNEDVNVNALGLRWKELVQKETWKVVVDPFWTLPWEFKFMPELAPDLYKKFTQSKLIIFKGDLNYRKLFGERNWDPTTHPEDALQGFLPSRLCALRTIKADIVVGLKTGIAEECHRLDPKWMENGDYGLIQFVNKMGKGW